MTFDSRIANIIGPLVDVYIAPPHSKSDEKKPCMKITINSHSWLHPFSPIVRSLVTHKGHIITSQTLAWLQASEETACFLLLFFCDD